LELITFLSPQEPFIRLVIGTALKIIADFLVHRPTFEYCMGFLPNLWLNPTALSGFETSGDYAFVVGLVQDLISHTSTRRVSSRPLGG
jgi:hypothetical protein